jgi:hypothetical protein
MCAIGAPCVAELEDGNADAATGHEGSDKQRAALRGML